MLIVWCHNAPGLSQEQELHDLCRCSAEAMALGQIVPSHGWVEYDVVTWQEDVTGGWLHVKVPDPSLVRELSQLLLAMAGQDL